VASRSLWIFKTASAAVRAVPLSLLVPAAEAAGAIAGPRLMGAKADMLGRHLRRAGGRIPDDIGAGFGSYARYWVESLRLPTLDVRRIDRGFSFVGYEHIVQVRAGGKGPILVLPHLGGWEWAAAWLGRVAEVPVTAVVERLEPDDVFAWFTELRASWGVDVVPLGSDAFARLTAAVRKRHIVCLLADRDIGDSGVEVEFFGEMTTMPVGPAVLAYRTGAPILPTAVFFSGRQRLCRVGTPIWPDDDDGGRPTSRSAGDGPAPSSRRGRGRDRYRRMTEQVTIELERLIAQAPDQWHLLEPNWPSDHR